MVVVVVLPKPPFTRPVVYGPFDDSRTAGIWAGRADFLQGLAWYVADVQKP